MGKARAAARVAAPAWASLSDDKLLKVRMRDLGLSLDHVTTVAALPMFHIYAMTCVMISTIELSGRIIKIGRASCRERV